MTYESTYAVIGMPIIGLLSLAGVLIPSLAMLLFPKWQLTKQLYFTFFNGLAAGIIIAVGFVHSIPDSESHLANVLTDPYSQVDSYAWFTFISLMAVLITFTIEEFCAFLLDYWDLNEYIPYAHGHGHGAMHKKTKRDDDSGSSGEDSSSDEKCDKKHHEDDGEEDLSRLMGILPLTKMFALFVGLLFHNFFVGIALGIADNDWILFIAIIFHQFFEGLGLGARVALTRIRNLLYIVVVDGAFSLSCPIGIGIGMLMKLSTDDSNYNYSIINGVFQGISAGILLYVGIMHMMRTYLECGIKANMLQWHRLVNYLGLLLGAGCMSVIGIWA